MKEGKKHNGKKETDSVFEKFLVPFWKKAVSISLTSIRGSNNAWCGLFVGAMLVIVGMKTNPGGAMARDWATYGQGIEWKTQGIPKGAIVHINHKGNCNSDVSNHVAFADGDCTAADLLKAGAVVPLYGGNQSDAVNTKFYSVKEICEVRYPDGVKLPGKIIKSVNCPQKAASGGSTR